MNVLRLIKAARVLLSLRAWRKSRTLKAAGVGVVGGATMALNPELVHLAAAAFNYVSPVDVTDAGMGGFLVFAVSVGAALLRADTHDSLATNTE